MKIKQLTSLFGCCHGNSGQKSEKKEKEKSGIETEAKNRLVAALTSSNS